MPCVRLFLWQVRINGVTPIVIEKYTKFVMAIFDSYVFTFMFWTVCSVLMDIYPHCSEE